MKCSNCSFENRTDARFCKRCGQPLPAQSTPPATPTPPGAICPACGATAKPGARFCPRCGNQVPAEQARPPAPPPQMMPTLPSMGPLPQPFGQPPTMPPPPKRRSSRWPLWVAGIFAILCVVAITLAAVFLLPEYIGGEETPVPTIAPTAEPTAEPSPTTPLPTDTPTPLPPPPPPPLSPEPTTEVSPTLSFDAQVGLSASATELRLGEPVTITVTITNTGGVPFGSLRYQLMGWEPYLAVTTDAVVEHELDLVPNQSDTVIFVLEAVQVGAARLQANVTVKTREDPPAIKPVSSEQIVEVSVVQ
ncbi:MAG: zinc ribbon domain-containing protein [Chloroflexi bacterium]|nr:zinc ribbon domain-containing protein [Chloroflexota bacterium]